MTQVDRITEDIAHMPVAAFIFRDKESDEVHYSTGKNFNMTGMQCLTELNIAWNISCNIACNLQAFIPVSDHKVCFDLHRQV